MSSGDGAPAASSSNATKDKDVDSMRYNEHTPRGKVKNEYNVSRRSSYPHILLTVFQRQIRNFLMAENIRVPGTKLQGTPPACATQQDVQSFCSDQSCRPHEDSAIMAWFEPLTSQWNKECIALLAKKAQSTLQALIAADKMPKVDQQWLSINFLCCQIATSLKPTSTKMALCTASPSMADYPSLHSRGSSGDKIKQTCKKAHALSRKKQVMIISSCVQPPATDLYDKKLIRGSKYVNMSTTGMKRNLSMQPWT